MPPIRNVEKSQAQALEPLGSKSKFWFREGDKRYLFKADSRGTGEDWAEVISFYLAELLGLPCVTYELATETELGIPIRPGVVCENMAPPPMWLVLGNQLMLAIDPNYPAEQRYKMQQHAVDAVVGVISLLDMPISSFQRHISETTDSALDVFVGYVMLDAWIANQDRHHENWGAIWDGELLTLAPTFDHGASLARNLRDAEREERLCTRDRNRQIGSFVQRARSAFYETSDSDRPMLTLDAFHAFGDHAPQSRDTWIQRLGLITEPDVWRIIDQIPENRMSDICKEFTLRLLLENQKRLLHWEAE